MSTMIYWIWLQGIFGPASRRAVKLLREFGNAQNIFNATDEEILEKGVLKKNGEIFKKLTLRDLSKAEETAERCAALGVTIATPGMRAYPRNLLSLPDAPLVLYVKGRLPDFTENCSIAVVGSRNMSEYGKVNAYRIGYGLAAAGAVVVSGIALGVDGVSMAGAIDAGGVTIGVIGCGIDIVYPNQHGKLHREIAEKGAVVSEYPPGTKVTKYAFPQRNRIVSGISQGVVVIEGKERSGALITARIAAFQGKSMFALPGHVDSPGSKGPIKLIREGAFAVTSAEDILEDYTYVYPHTLSLERMRYECSGANWKALVERSVKSHEVSYRPADYETQSLVVPSVEKTVKQAERKCAVSPVAETSADAPFVQRLGKNRAQGVDHMSLDMLGENEKKVFFAMPCDTPVIPDEIKVAGLGVGDILSSLTMLEICGAVEAGAGGYYMRSSEDGALFSDGNVTE